MQDSTEGGSSCWEQEKEESDTEEEEDDEDLEDTRKRAAWAKENIEWPRRVGEKQRARFLAATNLQHPEAFRVIDIKSTCSRRHVTLLDYQNVQASGYGYSAISHTYGLEVYSIFNCPCACVFSCINARIPPRCWDCPCPHTAPGECKDQRDRVINDILRMCDILGKAGVAYAWHDGVCIAQHDDNEVGATIQSMGWIYSSANETIVFLHYVGKPMAPIAPRGSGYDLACRWHTRVWTLQEAALSKKRRYCVRVCDPPLRFCHFSRPCNTPKKLARCTKEFEETIALWYRFDSSKIDVITEERFIVDYIQEAEEVACHLRLMAINLKENHSLWRESNEALGLDGCYTCIKSWFSCLTRLKETLRQTCLGFPTLGAALTDCSRRDSKHVGDRINSVLTLAGLKDFVVPKEFKEANAGTMEGWTIEFFERQGQGGLAWALFSLNVGRVEWNDGMQKAITCSWVPLLWRPLRDPDIVAISEASKRWGIKFTVCEDKRLRLKGELVCVPMTLTLKLKEDEPIPVAEHLAAEEGSGDEYVGEDLLTDDLHIAEENSVEACTDAEQDSFGDKHIEDGKDLLMYVDEANSNETSTDEQVSELEVDDDEQDEGMDEEELEVVAQHVKDRESLDLELNISAEGFIDTFLVRFLGMNIIMGAATFFPVQLNEEGDGHRIGDCEIKEGDSFNAFLLVPLHYEQKRECLIVQGNLGGHVSKIGVLTMFTKLERIFQMEVGKAIDHPAYKIVEELVIH